LKVSIAVEVSNRRRLHSPENYYCVQ